jgi:hypothetical protein
MFSPSPPPTSPPTPPPTAASTRKRKASVVDETLSQPQAKARAKADILRKSRENDAQRTTQLKFIMQEGERKGARARSDNEMKARKMEIARVPVHVKIQHCAIERQSGGRPRVGKVKASIMKDASIWTLHAPLLGYEGTTYQRLRSRLRAVYLEEFAAMHGGHNHPSDGKGDIMVDIRLKLSADDTGRLINEQNWQEALALLAAQQLPGAHLGKLLVKAHVATIVASFGCPGAVEEVKPLLGSGVGANRVPEFRDDWNAEQVSLRWTRVRFGASMGWTLEW